MFKKLALVAALATVTPSLSSAQLTDTNTPDCAFQNINTFNWGTSITYVGCFGSVSGNNEGNANPGATATLNQINTTWGGAYGPFTALGQTNAGDATGAGPFAAFSGGTTGSLTFDNPQFGYFVLGLKAGNSFSLYLLRSTAVAGALTVNYNTAGVDAQNGLSHGSLYQGSGGPSITSVPEPSTYALMGAGLLGIFGFARRRRNNA